MNVGRIMRWAVATVDAETRCAEAAALAASRGQHHLPVEDRGVVVGLVCRCQLARAPGRELVAQHMRTPVVTIKPHASIGEAAALMRRSGQGALPVLYHGFLIGIVAAGELARVPDGKGMPPRRRCPDRLLGRAGGQEQP